MTFLSGLFLGFAAVLLGAWLAAVGVSIERERRFDRDIKDLQRKTREKTARRNAAAGKPPTKFVNKYENVAPIRRTYQRNPSDKEPTQ